MKRMIQFTMTLTLIICCAMSCAYAADIATIPTDTDFYISDVIAAEPDTFVLVGRTGVAHQKIPTIFEVDINGTIKHELRHNDAFNLPFRDITKLNDDRYLVTRHKDEETTSTIGEIISTGEIRSQIDLPPNIFGLYALSDGFLIVCSDDFNECRIEKRTMLGELLWESNVAQVERLQDFIELDGSYYLVGYKSADREAYPKGVILQFSDQGELLWRYDSDTNEEYIQAFLSADGGIVVYGEAIGNNGTTLDDSGCYYNFIAKFDKNGQVWRTDCHYGTQEFPKDGHAQSMVALEDGYLAAAIVRGQRHEVTLHHFNAEGELQKTWAEPVGDLYKAHFLNLQHHDGEITLIGQGTPSAEDKMSRVTIIKRILMDRK